MTDSTGETAIKALATTIAAALPQNAAFERNMAFDGHIPVGGLVIVRDGTPGEPAVLMSPLSYTYDHAAEVEIMVEDARQDQRDAVFDALRGAIGAAIQADQTLGGAVDHAEAVAAGPIDLRIEGAESVKAISLQVRLTYTTADPLN